MKKWKCLVCGYIHTGDEPPEKCPVCGADKSQFVEVTDEESQESQTTAPSTDSSPPPPSESTSIVDKALGLMVKHHLHPISVHIPNGVIPVCFLFLVLAVIFSFLDTVLLSKAAYLNLIVVFLSMPLVVFSGLIAWRRKYNSARTTYFIIKIACGLTVPILALVIIVWLIFVPDVAASGQRWLFLLLNLVLLGIVGIAGYIGGKLVFKD